MNFSSAKLFLLTFVLALCCGCSGPKSFKVTGEVKDGGNINLYLKYYADGSVHSAVTAVTAGKFAGEFVAATPALVEIQDNDARVLGRMYVRNGDDLTVVIDRANPALSKVTGTAVNDSLSAVINANADMIAKADARELNSWVEDYIAQHPADPVSALLYASFYDFSIDPVKAGETLENISVEARLPEVLDSYTAQIRRFATPAAYANVEPIIYKVVSKYDSVAVFDPKDKLSSLIVISNENSSRSDSIVPPLKRIYKALPEKKTQIIDFVLFAEHSTARNVVRRDSAKWTQAWVPGAILADGLDRLAIPKVPYFIVTDSAGAQIYRGASIDSAETVISDYVKGL